MSTQPEALRLADALEMSSNHGIRREAAAELRRLHAELERCKQVCAATSEAWREEAALAEPVPGQGCDHCNHPLYAATRCRVCGRVTSAEPPCATRECMPSECPNCASLEAQNTELDRKLAEMEAALRAQL